LACLGHARLLGLRPGSYAIPLGGTTPLATLGYVGAALELLAQVRDGRLPEPEKIFIAFATGGSVAGLLIGLALAESPTRVVAVQTVDTVVANRRRLEHLVRKTLAILLPGQLRIGDCMARLDSIDGRFLGRGYRDVPASTLAAVRVAQSRELALEPVFTGKALAALLQDMRERPEQKLLFWNTHDQLHAHQTE
jgi:D-cysteine desulfhydrase